MRINAVTAGYHFAINNDTQNCGSLFSGVLKDGTPMVGQMSLFYNVGDMDDCTGWEWNGTPSSFDPDEGQEAIDACHDAWLEAMDGPIGKLIENGCCGWGGGDFSRPHRLSQKKAGPGGARRGGGARSPRGDDEDESSDDGRRS